MNLREEILKNAQLTGNTPLITTEMAVELAEQYAKDRAWLVYKRLNNIIAIIQNTTFDEALGRRSFEGIYEETKEG